MMRARYKKLGLSPEEEEELLAYDLEVHADDKCKKRLKYDLTPEQHKIAQKYVATGTREKKEEKKARVGTAFKFDTRKRAPNEVKSGLIEELYSFLSQIQSLSIENLEIVNKEGKISFHVGENGRDYSLTLTQHNKKK